MHVTVRARTARVRPQAACRLQIVRGIADLHQLHVDARRWNSTRYDRARFTIEDRL